MTLKSVHGEGGMMMGKLETPTTGFQFPQPSYLNDLRNTPPTPGCSCETLMDDDKINDMFYDPHVFVHTVAYGSIVERIVSGVDSHPYHQHVFPYQLESFLRIDESDAEYFHVGDYHDSISIRSSEVVTIRYAATSFAGRIPVHCHRTTHSDLGMISAEDVVFPE